MKTTLRKFASFTLRWGIAVVGIWWVISNMSIADHALIVDDTHHRPVQVRISEQLSPERYRVIDPFGVAREISTGDMVNEADRKTVELGPEKKRVSLLALDLDGEKGQTVKRLLVADKPDGDGRWVDPSAVAGGFQLQVPYPKIEVGLRRMVANANPSLLLLSVLIFPITILITSIRWHKMLGALDIHLALLSTTALNWVGLFYNTFIPMGSTGGDLLKAYYAAAHTPYKTRAVMSVIVDRVIGLVVLIIMGGMIAAGYWAFSSNKLDQAVRTCGWIGSMAGLIVLAMAVFLMVAFTPWLRSVTGFEKTLSKLPMQKQVQAAIEVMTIYRQRPGLMLWSMLVTFPVHLTVVVSAMLAGKALGLPIATAHYFVIVPVTVLVGAIPISPQGIGVMEVTAYGLMSYMTSRQVNGQDVLALTMSIRVVQILWNLVGGVFVISGHYRPPENEEVLPTGSTAAVD